MISKLNLEIVYNNKVDQFLRKTFKIIKTKKIWIINGVPRIKLTYTAIMPLRIRQFKVVRVKTIIVPSVILNANASNAT